MVWSDVHLDAARPKAVLRDTKGLADRTIPLMPPVVAMLREIRRDLGPVFVQVHPDTVSDWCRELSEKCGIKARPHDFRHAATTYMIVAGMSPAIVQEILGHAQLSTTQIYIHLIKDHLYDEMEKLKFE